MVSTLKVTKIQIPNSDSDVITLDASSGNITFNKAVTSSVTQLGNTLQTKYSQRIPGAVFAVTSFTEIHTNMRVTMTIQSATSILDFTCPLYTEVDGVSTHGTAQLQYSTNGGSDWTAIGVYTVTQAVDNGVGYGFTEFFDHSFSVGQSVVFRVNYAMGSASQNHTIADSGPGKGQPYAYLKVSEIIGTAA